MAIREKKGVPSLAGALIGEMLGQHLLYPRSGSAGGGCAHAPLAKTQGQEWGYAALLNCGASWGRHVGLCPEGNAPVWEAGRAASSGHQKGQTE